MTSSPSLSPLPWVFALDPGSATPVYLQVAQGLTSRIESGVLEGGAALPSERELAAELGVSRVTVRQALTLLAQQGTVTRRHGSGTFVNPPARERAERPLGQLTGFSEDVRSRGQVPGARVLGFECTRPTPQETMTLALSPSEKVYRVRRLRTADGEPLAVEESVLPAARLGPLNEREVTDTSLYALLAARDLSPVRAVRHLRAVNAAGQLAGWLGVPVGAALLATERVSWTAGGHPIEHAHAHYRGDRYDFVMELQAGEDA
ncbi:GntR family transcriptional regulator [Deinococcus hopiensis]|uniref:Transcriptional regulator, GntR family n=1 Tax=Deinococcus hopiensis KR-140 TaxID=695939 RepID=A0A1W1UFJ9_9DEIO|nr:GntR family transcriptional regulator [Deinococcus hopiensis]SMB79856.1 transcriptional regulator, GntR family [Deinococcus hopiensis KR-140]